MKILLLFSIFILLLIKLSKAYILKCDTDNSQYNCTVTGPRDLINPANEIFSDDLNVISISFNNFEMVNLTSEWCDRFINLRELRAQNVSLVQIDVNAFNNCKNLLRLDLSHNNLTFLDKNVFKYNTELEKITLLDNNFEKLDVDIFIPTNKLKHLSLNQMQGIGLTDFPSYRMPFLPHLEYLTIDSNGISDIDEEEIVRKFPNLKKIAIEDNPFHCGRLKEMFHTFAARNVEVKRFDHVYHRPTQYPLKKIGEADCLENDQFDKQNPVDERIFALRDETKWIRKQLRQVNATLYQEINELKHVANNNKTGGQCDVIIQSITEITTKFNFNLNSLNIRVTNMERNFNNLRNRVECVEQEIIDYKEWKKKFELLENKFIQLENSTKTMQESNNCCKNGPSDGLGDKIWSKWEQMKNFTVESCRHVMLIF